MPAIPFHLGHTRRRKSLTLSDKERSVHMQIVGGSGRGKSTLLEHMIRQDINNARGVCLIDPHGTLYEAIVRWCVTHDIGKRRKVHLIEPGNAEWCFGFNPLRFERDALSTGVASVVSAFAQVWGGEDLDAKPRLLRSLTALLYLLAEHRLTLSDAVELMSESNKGLRERLGGAIESSYFRNEWELFNAMGASEWREYFESTGNRLGPFLSSDTIWTIVGQTEKAIDFSKAMEKGEVVLVNLARTRTFSAADGDLLGALIVNDLFQRALRRKVDARPFYCYIDECYRFLNSDIEGMLDQTRKFGLHLVLAHQRIGQLRERGEGISNAVMSIQNKVVFGGLIEGDAKMMAAEIFSGEFDLQRPKQHLTSPVVVGHVPEWFESLSSSDAFSESESESDGTNESTGEGESTGHVMTPDDPFRTSESSSRSTGFGTSRASAHGSTQSSSTTRGQSQGLRPIIEERATREYSLDELIYEASARLKDLKVGEAVVKVIERRTAHIKTPLPFPGTSDQRRIKNFRRNTFSGSRFVQARGEAMRQIKDRQAALLIPHITDTEPAALYPKRRVKKQEALRPLIPEEDSVPISAIEPEQESEPVLPKRRVKKTVE